MFETGLDLGFTTHGLLYDIALPDQTQKLVIRFHEIQDRHQRVADVDRPPYHIGRSVVIAAPEGRREWSETQLQVAAAQPNSLAIVVGKLLPYRPPAATSLINGLCDDTHVIVRRLQDVEDDQLYVVREGGEGLQPLHRLPLMTKELSARIVFYTEWVTGLEGQWEDRHRAWLAAVGRFRRESWGSHGDADHLRTCMRWAVRFPQKNPPPGGLEKFAAIVKTHWLPKVDLDVIFDRVDRLAQAFKDGAGESIEIEEKFYKDVLINFHHLCTTEPDRSDVANAVMAYQECLPTPPSPIKSKELLQAGLEEWVVAVLKDMRKNAVEEIRMFDSSLPRLVRDLDRPSLQSDDPDVQALRTVARRVRFYICYARDAAVRRKDYFEAAMAAAVDYEIEGEDQEGEVVGGERTSEKEMGDNGGKEVFIISDGSDEDDVIDSP